MLRLVRFCLGRRRRGFAVDDSHELHFGCSHQGGVAVLVVDPKRAVFGSTGSAQKSGAPLNKHLDDRMLELVWIRGFLFFVCGIFFGGSVVAAALILARRP